MKSPFLSSSFLGLESRCSKIFPFITGMVNISFELDSTFHSGIPGKLTSALIPFLDHLLGPAWCFFDFSARWMQRKKDTPGEVFPESTSIMAVGPRRPRDGGLQFHRRPEAVRPNILMKATGPSAARGYKMEELGAS